MSSEPTPKRRSASTALSRAETRKRAAERAQAEGKLPHEILLDIARGTPQIQSRLEWDANGKFFKQIDPVVLIPDMQQRMNAARDAAPYYAPKLSALEILQGMTDDQLDEALGVLAAQAGFGPVAAGESEAQQAAPPAGGHGNVPALRPDGDELGDAGGASAS